MLRALRAGALHIEPIDREVVYTRDQWTCYLCGITTDPDASPYDLRSPTVDHVIALSRRGSHTYDNVRCCCLGCNSTKRDLDAGDFATGGAA